MACRRITIEELANLPQGKIKYSSRQNCACCDATTHCTYCGFEYFPLDNPDFDLNLTTDPANCPQGTVAMNQEPGKWSCRKILGPFGDVTPQDLTSNIQLLLQYCPLQGQDYLTPTPYDGICCSGNCCGGNQDCTNGICTDK